MLYYDVSDREERWPGRPDDLAAVASSCMKAVPPKARLAAQVGDCVHSLRSVPQKANKAHLDSFQSCIYTVVRIRLNSFVQLL